MDLTTPKYYQPSSLFASSQMESHEAKTKENPFAEALHGNEADPICKLNLKETSEFVKSLPMSTSNSTQLSHKKRDNTNNNHNHNNYNNNHNNFNNNVVGNSNSNYMMRRLEPPSTPGRPVFSFSVARKSVPSKWDDAEKWLFNNGGSSCHESPSHHAFNTNINNHNYSHNINHNVIKQSEGPRSSHSKAIISELIAEKSRLIEEQKVGPKLVNCSSNGSSLEDQHYHYQQHKHAITFNGVIIPADLPLKDKFTDEIGPLISNLRHSEPTKEAFLFKSHKLDYNEAMTDACTEMIPIQEVKHRDIGTDMTPLGSSTTSRCHTPFKSTSPARHNTPASRSGLLTLTGQPTNQINMAQFQECHFAKLQIGSTQFDSVATNWSSREEEEEEISKSLRHFEIGRRSVSVSESRACAWEEEEKTKFCLRYQREEAKIQAWINLQNAKAEAQSRKLEVKIQKMRSNLEEKLMRRMGIVHRKAEEWRAAAQVEHSEQLRRASERAQKLVANHQHNKTCHLSPQIISCGCFPCTATK